MSQPYPRQIALSVIVLFGASAFAPIAFGAEDELRPEMRALLDARPKSQTPASPKHATPCVGGMAGTYPCSNVDLLAFVPVAEFAAASTNSLWGWTDPQTAIEYAVVGVNNGTVFYDLSVPDHPRYLGKLPTHTGSSLWRDVRVYANHAFVVSDNNGSHGMQVFDLTRLRAVTTPQTFSENGFYGAFGRGHTIAINEQSGFAFVAGTNTCSTPTGTGAPHIVDIRNPTNPVFAGCVATGGYTHETQCWIYNGPDSAHVGKDVCFNSNGSSGRVAVVDVSNKSAPITLSSTAYAGSGYTHQGWLTEDHKYFLMNDELDETNNGHNARTYVFDVSNLDAPVAVGYHEHALPVIDHNLYVHGQYVYQSNYEAGLRILRIGNLSQAELTEVAYFDTYPSGQGAQFNGTWNNYRFPGTGNVIVTGIDEGFFVLHPNLCSPSPAPAALSAVGNGDQRIDLNWSSGGPPETLFRIERAQGGCGGSFLTIASGVASTNYSDYNASGQVNYGYRVIANDANGACVSPASTCVSALTTGSCTAPPLFNGLTQASSGGSANCRIDLAWSGASPACGGPASYSVYRSGSSNFVPSSVTRVAQGILGNAYSDTSVPGMQAQYYVVRANDTANGSEESNSSQLVVSASGPIGDGTFSSGAEPGEPPMDATSSAVELQPPLDKHLKHAGWHTSTASVHSGARSFWSTSANNLCVSLVTAPLTLTAGQASQLSFWSAWDIEQGWDGGVVEVSVNSGATWQRLTPAGGYPGTITQGGTLCGIAQGDGVFTGLNAMSWSSPYSIDLSAYTGQTVQLRWLYRTDDFQADDGWFVDDIALTHAQVPGVCTPQDLLFANGFD